LPGRHGDSGFETARIIGWRICHEAAMHGPNDRCNFGSVGSGELRDAVKEFDTDDAIGCIVITGSGARAFAAGGDIHEQRKDDRPPQSGRVGRPARARRL
jgi:1,4-dihydroxy-2-naphthoyl-CoA synthase